MASSELAQRTKKTVDDEGYYDMDAASEAVDKYILQEVRGVLIQTADRNMEKHGPCWCRKDLTNDAESHNEFCLRARALWGQLEIK